MEKKEPDFLDDLLNLAKRISAADISDNMKDILLQHVLKGRPSAAHGEIPEDGDDRDALDFQFPTVVRSFMHRYGVLSDEMGRVFHLESDDVDFLVPGLGEKNNTEGVRHCVLLVALKSALTNNNWTVPIKEVRKVAGNFGVYDVDNFATAMRRNADLLRNFRAGEDSELSGKGQQEAASLIKKLASAQ